MTPPLPLEPLDIPWTCKSVETARSGIDVLQDGRIRCWIEHDLIRGVTPKMLVWWLQHLEGDVVVNGQRVPRYRLWHPRDHVAIEYSRRNPDGSIGPGCEIQLTEMLGDNLKHLLQVRTLVTQLDEHGFGHRPRLHGLRIATMEYSFRETDEGTLYRNRLTAGLTGLTGKVLNPLLRGLLFEEARGRAWIKHNIEEVGNFESFLPQLYAAAVAGAEPLDIQIGPGTAPQR